MNTLNKSAKNVIDRVRNGTRMRFMWVGIENLFHFSMPMNYNYSVTRCSCKHIFNSSWTLNSLTIAVVKTIFPNKTLNVYSRSPVDFFCTVSFQFHYKPWNYWGMTSQLIRLWYTWTCSKLQHGTVNHLTRTLKESKYSYLFPTRPLK